MAGSSPREAPRCRGPEGGGERDGGEGGGQEKGAQLGSVTLKRGSHWVIAPVCLLLALSMRTMCAQICPQSAGAVSKETAD